MRTITMKFGGTSVGTVEAIRSIVGIVSNAIQAEDRVIVVVSAMSSVTDTLLSAVQMAVDGDKWGYLSVAQKLRDRHEEAVNQLVRPGEPRERVLMAINKLLDEYTELCQAVNILGEATPRIYDWITSFGERMSCLVVSAALVDAGMRSRPYNAGQFIITDDNHQNASPLWDITQANIRRKLYPTLDEGTVPVITGFIGATQDGAITTLGRGGSDFSAAVFAAYTYSEELIIWTDVDGVMTTDPRIDPRAQVLSSMSYQEVGEMAFYGAKVLHPKTVQPILDMDMPLRVCNTFNPTHPGTRITREAQPVSTVIKAVSSVRNVSMLTVSGRGMLGVPGIAGRTFIATAQAGASILMISQSSSEQSFCYIVTDHQAPAARDAVRTELNQEINRGDVDDIDLRSDVVIVTAVGAGMRGTPGVAGRVFGVLGTQAINVLMIAQGSSESSISFVVSEADLERAVIALHDLALSQVEAADAQS